MATSNIEEQDRLLEVDTYAGADETEEEEEETESSSMTLIEHLEELRRRIFKMLIAVGVGSVIAFIFREQIMKVLTAPLPKQAEALGPPGKLVVTGIAEGLTVFIMISLAAGIILALPVILYQIWAFVSPGLYERERKYALPFVIVGVLLFTIGVTFGYFVLRYPVEWLVSFSADTFTQLITANSYFTFVAFFILVFGLIFELPLVLTFMAQVGWVSTDFLKRKRYGAHLGMWLAACFVTPGADLYSPIFVGTAMSLLYELTILFIRFTVERKSASA
jgi:sec-independent protein translocase protein TatC